MGFSDKMRESLGAEGARVQVETSEDSMSPGSRAEAKVTIHGGTAPARIDLLRVRLIEARRHWTERDGSRVEEADAARLEDRGHLMPAWTQATVFEQSVEVGSEVGPGDTTVVDIALDLPENLAKSSPAYVVTLNAQADIKGQIDPTGNASLTIG